MCLASTSDTSIYLCTRPLQDTPSPARWRCAHPSCQPNYSTTTLCPISSRSS